MRTSPRPSPHPPAPRVVRDLPPFELPELGPRPKDPYQAMRHDLQQARRDLYLRHLDGEVVTADATATLMWHLPAMMKSWVGTRYSYSGTTQTPRRGAIACGYYVSTILQHAGFSVDRVDLARQASEQIIRTLIPDPQIERFRWWSPARVSDQVAKSPEGVYIVGLDTHVGFLVASEGQVTFCHSTSRRERRRRVGVVCEPARTSPSFKSRYNRPRAPRRSGDGRGLGRRRRAAHGPQGPAHRVVAAGVGRDRGSGPPRRAPPLEGGGARVVTVAEGDSFEVAEAAVG